MEASCLGEDSQYIYDLEEGPESVQTHNPPDSLYTSSSVKGCDAFPVEQLTLSFTIPLQL